MAGGGVPQQTTPVNPGINLTKKHVPAWKGKAAPTMVYVQMGTLHGKHWYLACWKPTAVHFGMTYEEHYFASKNKHGEAVRVKPNLHRTIKLPKMSNASYAKVGKAKKHAYYSVRVSSGLKLDDLMTLLHHAITKNTPDYIVNHSGVRAYMSRAKPKKS